MFNTNYYKNANQNSKVSLVRMAIIKNPQSINTEETLE